MEQEMTGPDGRPPRTLGAHLAGRLPGLAERLKNAVAGAVEDWQAYDAEQLAEAQAQVRASRIAQRLEILLAHRADEYAGDWPLLPEAAKYAAGLAEGKYPGILWLTGTHGAGKSTAAWKVAETAVRAGFVGVTEVVSAGDLWEALSPPVDLVAIHRWAAVGLLIFDDFAVDGISDWELKHLFRVINIRWERHKPVIFASAIDLASVLDAKTWSRVESIMTPVHMGDVDHRKGRRP